MSKKRFILDRQKLPIFAVILEDLNLCLVQGDQEELLFTLDREALEDLFELHKIDLDPDATITKYKVMKLKARLGIKKKRSGKVILMGKYDHCGKFEDIEKYFEMTPEEPRIDVVDVFIGICSSVVLSFGLNIPICGIIMSILDGKDPGYWTVFPFTAVFIFLVYIIADFITSRPYN